MKDIPEDSDKIVDVPGFTMRTRYCSCGQRLGERYVGDKCPQCRIADALEKIMALCKATLPGLCQVQQMQAGMQMTGAITGERQLHDET